MGARRCGLISLVALLLWLAAGAASAATLIRDTEIEATLAEMTAPIFDAAGLDADAVRVAIVRDERTNAFVAGGMNLFINTGLLLRTEHAGQLLGVLAHETGHIAGGHLSRIDDALRGATFEAIAGAVLGAAAAMAGAGDLGAAIMSGGQRLAEGSLYSFSRGQEQAADQAAVTFLERAGISPRGLLEFFKLLERQNALMSSSSTPFLRTHPLTRERIQFLESYLRRTPGSDAPPPARYAVPFARMIAKLRAFLDEPERALAAYADDDSVSGRYARAVALYRLPDLPRATAEIDALLAEFPNDPYFHELKGQMLFENGRVAEAVAPYREAVRLRPDAALLRLGLGRALLASGELDAAVDQLSEAVRLERGNAMAWRQLGIAHGRAGDLGPSELALAEAAFLTNRRDDARRHVQRAEAHIGPRDASWLRLQDLKRALEAS